MCLFLMRRQCTMVSLTARIMGKKPAMGKFRCTIDPLIFPKARIFPIRCSVHRTGELFMVWMWLTVLMGVCPGLGCLERGLRPPAEPGVRVEAAGSAGPGVTPEALHDPC